MSEDRRSPGLLTEEQLGYVRAKRDDSVGAEKMRLHVVEVDGLLDHIDAQAGVIRQLRAALLIVDKLVEDRDIPKAWWLTSEGVQISKALEASKQWRLHRDG